jgi:AcrR family transcriptional regulator
METTVEKPEGLRERKRRETRYRIVKEGLRLFMANGFEATTLLDIAAASDISRRTFFYYFKSKDDILLAWEGGIAEALREGVIAEGKDRPPLDVVESALSKLIARYASEEFIAIDGLLRSTDTLKARKQGHYDRQEKGLFETLCDVWPEPERRPGLRVVAMVAIGAMRLATEAWMEDGGSRPIAGYLDRAFARIKAEI